MSERQGVSPTQPFFGAANLVRAELFISTPPNHAGGNVDLMKAETLIADVTIPAVFIAAEKEWVYVAELPEMRSKFARSLIYRAVYRGEIHTADEWCQILAGDGVGYTIKGGETVRPIGEETFRADFNLLAALTKLPLGSKASDGEHTGFGLARSWQQIKDSEIDLNRRADRMYERYLVGEKVEAAEDGWFAGQKNIPVSSRWDQELVEMIVTELSLRNHTNGEVALMLAAGKPLRELRRLAKSEGGEVELLTEEQRRRYESLCDAPVRGFMHWLALGGVPVCAGSAGYWIAKSRSEFRDFLGRPHQFTVEQRRVTIHTGLLGRIEAVREHAASLPDVMALWYPQDRADRQRREEILAVAPVPFDLSPIAKERLRLRRQAEQQRRHDKAADEGRDFLAAAKAFLEDRADEYLAAKDVIEAYAASQGGSNPPTKDQITLSRRYLTARKVSRMKSPRRQKIKTGQVPMLWEYVPGQDDDVKLRGVKVASAAELTTKASTKAVEPCPW